MSVDCTTEIVTIAGRVSGPPCQSVIGKGISLDRGCNLLMSCLPMARSICSKKEAGVKHSSWAMGTLSCSGRSWWSINSISPPSFFTLLSLVTDFSRLGSGHVFFERFFLFSRLGIPLCLIAQSLLDLSTSNSYHCINGPI